MKLAVVIVMAQLIGSLQGVPGTARDEAITQVSGLPDAAVWAMLDSANWRGRDAAITGLEEAVPPRMHLLLEIGRKHPKLATRRTAMRAIGRTDIAGYCDSLSSFLGQDSDSVVLDAMVGRTDCQNVVVDPYLDDPDDDVRRRAYQLLVSMNQPRALAEAESALGDSHYGVRQLASAFLKQSGDDAIPLLKAAMKDTSRLRRSTALMTLGEVGEVGRVVLANSFGTSEWYDRVIAADGLGRIGGAQAVDSIELQILVETHPLVLVSLKRARTQALRERP